MWNFDWKMGRSKPGRRKECCLSGNAHLHGQSVLRTFKMPRWLVVGWNGRGANPYGKQKNFSVSSLGLNVNWSDGFAFYVHFNFADLKVPRLVGLFSFYPEDLFFASIIQLHHYYPQFPSCAFKQC